jgi:putative transposase
MNLNLVLIRNQRRQLLDLYRKDPDPEVRFRAHILLLLAAGHTWQTVAATLFCSSRTIDRWVKRFEHEGLDGLRGRKRGRPFHFAIGWVGLIVSWAADRTPRHFGFLRSRWSCAALALALWQTHRIAVSRETVRRWLHRGAMVYRRPRPVLKPTDEERAKKLAALRELVAGLPEDETVVFRDEVDIHSNPKIGPMWMRRGQQATVPTPGTNEKRCVAGSIHWRTGTVFLTEGGPRQGRDTKLFLAHLDELRSRLRCYRKIPVICDNAKSHGSQEVGIYLWKYRHRIDIHFLPRYSPDLNPIERIWWHLHDEITRNHQCPDLAALLELVFAWLEEGNPFQVEGSAYPRPVAA